MNKFKNKIIFLFYIKSKINSIKINEIQIMQISKLLL